MRHRFPLRPSPDSRRGFRSARLWQLLCAVVVTAVLLTQPLTTAGTATAATKVAALPAGFTDSVAISGLTNPTVIQFASDGSIVIAEKSGRIWSYPSLSDTHPTLVADLSAEVDNY